jgi:hypothetical protein
MRIRRTAVVLGTAAALAVVPVGTGVAQAGTTVAFNDSSSSFKVGENYRDYTLPAGRTSRGWLGLSDVDTIVTTWSQCGTISIDYGTPQVIHSNRTGIPADAKVVHVKLFTC